MTIIYLLHEVVSVESKRFEVTYLRDSLLIKKSSLFATEFCFVLESSSLCFNGKCVSVWRADDTSVPTASICAADDFPNVADGNSVTKNIDNNKNKFIIDWKHDIYEGETSKHDFFSSDIANMMIFYLTTNEQVRQSKNCNKMLSAIFTWKVYAK